MQLERDGVLAELSRLSEPVAKALSFAPVAAGFRSTVVSLEVREHDPRVHRASELRVLG